MHERNQVHKKLEEELNLPFFFGGQLCAISLLRYFARFLSVRTLRGFLNSDLRDCAKGRVRAL
jgi:hypothetical protein